MAARKRSTAPRSDDRTAVRIAACYGLLARAAIEIGIRAEGSAKLSRALEDISQARDTLAELARGCVETPESSVALDAASIRALVFSAVRNSESSWEYWREREQHRRRDSAR